ncbi:restriction endonuclease subunit S [Aeromonas caviae]|nr:restriction endonuclease subunit S [Aeromonas caviae]
MQETADKAIPAGYKQTEVGVIPEDWSVSTIGDCTRWMSGGTPNRNIDKYWHGTIPWISGSTLKNFFISTSDQFLTEIGVVSGGRMAPIGSVLILVRGSALHNEIRAGLVIEPVSFNQDVKALIPIDILDSRYLTFFILGMKNSLLKLVSSAGNSAGVLDTELVKNFKLYLPSKIEQIAIANVLSDSDALINALEQLIAKKQAIKSAAMQQLLTGRTRLPAFALRPDGTPKGYKPSELGDIPEDWEVAPFGNTLAIRHGKNQKAVENPNGTIPIFATGGQIGWAHQYLWNKPSVLIGRKGTIDKPRYSDKPFWTVDTLFYSEIKDCADPKFIFYKFCMIDWMQYNEASGVPSLNASTIERVLASLPLKEEQTAVAKILSDMDTEIQVLEQRLGKTCQIKQGMMQELLTGKTRLIEGSEAI